MEGRVAVLESRVSCIHREAGCGWVGQLGRLQAHLSACQKDAVYCTNNCGAKVRIGGSLAEASLRDRHLRQALR